MGARQGCVGFGYLVSPLGPPLLPPLATAASAAAAATAVAAAAVHSIPPFPPPPAATSFSSLRLSPAAAASPPFSLCSTSLAHSPFLPSLFPCRTPQCGASRFFNEGSAQYLGCHNLPPTSQGGPPATANPPSHPTSASRLYGAHEPTSHHLARPLVPLPLPPSPSPIHSFLFPRFLTFRSTFPSG